MKNITKLKANVSKRLVLIKRHANNCIAEIEETIKLSNELGEFGTVVNLQKSLEALIKIKNIL